MKNSIVLVSMALAASILLSGCGARQNSKTDLENETDISVMEDDYEKIKSALGTFSENNDLTCSYVEDNLSKDEYTISASLSKPNAGELYLSASSNYNPHYTISYSAETADSISDEEIELTVSFFNEISNEQITSDQIKEMISSSEYDMEDGETKEVSKKKDFGGATSRYTAIYKETQIDDTNLITLIFICQYDTIIS